MAITIQIKRDTASNWTSNASTLAAGEFGFETDTGKFKVGDGSTAWASLDYFEPTVAAPSYTFQGSTSGYASGAYVGPLYSNVIDKFPFSSDGNATDVGDLTVARGGAAGQSSSDNGYTSGGWAPPGSNVIDKFAFSSDGNATDVGDLTVIRTLSAGQSSSTHGYTSGGAWPLVNVIDKFTFSSDGNATDVGDLTTVAFAVSGQSSTASGYTSGGTYSQPGIGDLEQNVIDKFPFSSDANATDVGDLTNTRTSTAGQSSSDNGYVSGGTNFNNNSSQGYLNIIDKFPFSSDANATDVGDLTSAVKQQGGQSSTTNGYASGGTIPLTPNVNVIEKFPFSSDANATDVGDLTVARNQAAGQQV